MLPRLREKRELLPVVFPTLISGSPSGSASVVLRGWQNDPLEGLKETVAIALYASAAENPADRDRFQGIVLEHQMGPLGEFLAACHEVSGRRLMVILDQFEEYSLYHPNDDGFGEQFPGAIVAGGLSVSFLVSLREDALAKLDRFKGRIPMLWDSYRRVDHLDPAAAEDAIRLPLREYNRRQPENTPIEIQDVLVEAVLRDVQTENVQFEETGIGTLAAPSAERRIETPYLQLVMSRLWEREQKAPSTILRWTTLQEEGGAAKIVLTHLDRVMQQFTAEEQDIAARVFHRLVTPSGAKISFSVRDLADYETIEPKRLAPILQRLEEGSRRILRRVAFRSDLSDEPRYEIFHDRLGKAILSWRAKRLQEQERDKRQRDEAEQQRLAEQARANFRQPIIEAMDYIGLERQANWVRMMFYLVSTDGRRLAQTTEDLAELSGQPQQIVEATLKGLMEVGILRSAYVSVGDSKQLRYEVAHDALASALLEWHSQYVLDHSRAPTGDIREETVSSIAEGVLAPRPGDSFPYSMMCELLKKGRVIPILGAGVSLSARPQNNSSLREKKPFLPSNRELKELLARYCKFPASEFETSDISEVASFYVQQLGRHSFDVFLHDILGRTDYTPSETHRFLAQASRLRPLLILTTNYDTLMEQALDEAGQPYGVVAYVPGGRYRDKQRFAFIHHGALEPEFMDPEFFLPDITVSTLICKVRGPAIKGEHKSGSYVLTEEDHMDWLFPSYTSGIALPPFVVGKIAQSQLLWLGHSARDWPQRALLRRLYEAPAGQSELRSFSVALNPTTPSVMTWQRYAVEVFNIDLNVWAARMEDFWASTG